MRSGFREPAIDTPAPRTEEATLVKALIVLLLSIAAAALSAQAPAAAAVLLPHDARPEAIVTGATLLLLAALIKRGLATRREK